ncbi:hypothetical protein E3N88_02730 [Mikania micrantha]|uniref:PRISE-like Rossmann-fold domain-containing protein n=1 Tax=Mikania micrantha TaxID=192012 RepID=A0A5N6Q4J9_9ASTR|nr:hypothetical protein E3N88_02730 [Mikania micrantha]
MESTNQSVALIVGVTGMTGVALTEALKMPAALGGPWVVYGVSRRSLPSWFPSSLLNNHIMLDTLNQQQTHKILAPLSSQITHVFWVALQVNESEEVNISLNSTMLSNVLEALTYIGNKYSWEHFWDMADARVLAEQQIWASVTDKANNEAFNCTNGDVFTWKMIWKVLCDAFGVEFVPFDEEENFDFVDFMKDKGEVWDTIVEEKGLYATKMEEITCVDALCQLLKLEIQHVCSMNKSREFGFHGYENTLKSIPEWVDRMRQMKILP